MLIIFSLYFDCSGRFTVASSTAVVYDWGEQGSPYLETVDDLYGISQY
jgi:hypothetical protein